MAITSINEILNSSAQISVNNNKLVIKENNNDGFDTSLKKITITDINSNSCYSYKLDKHHPLTSYFDRKNNKGINKGADALILYEKDNNFYILFIELKSKRVNKKEVANKFCASASFVQHLNALIKNFYKKNIDSFKTFAVLFTLNKKSNGRVAKFRMRPDIPSFNNLRFKNNIDKNVQVLEIKKDNGKNFNISLNKIINESRSKLFKNWP